VERLLAIMRDSVGSKNGVHVIVMHTDVPGEVEKLKERITSELECTEIYIRDFTPVMGIHTGPGLLGIAFYAES